MSPDFEAVRQLGRLDEVVFDRVARSQHASIRQPRQRRHDLALHVGRQAHRQTVDVDLVDADALGFEVEKVALSIGKAHHLVFEGGTIARADALIAPL